jgi:N-acetylmuramoyl-L-alanine amidase
LIEREEGIAPDLPTAALPWSVTSIVSEMSQGTALTRSQDWAVALADGLQRMRPRARFRGVRQAPFGVLKEARMPAVVLEVGYITQLSEARTLLETNTHTQFGAAILLAMQSLDKQIAVENAGRKVPGR